MSSSRLAQAGGDDESILDDQKGATYLIEINMQDCLSDCPNPTWKDLNNPEFISVSPHQPSTCFMCKVYVLERFVNDARRFSISPSTYQIIMCNNL